MTEKPLNGWMTQHAERRCLHGSRIRRAARIRALKRGEADSIFEPFSKRLAQEFDEAVLEFLTRPGAKITKLPMRSEETERALERIRARARKDAESAAAAMAALVAAE